MKKIISIILTITVLFLVCSLTTSCNQGFGLGSHTFTKVHICVGDVNKCVELEKWYDNDGMGIEVKTKNYGALFLSEGTYILIEDKCPLCNK